MAVLNWGKPKLEICKLVDGEIPSLEPQWTELPTPVEGSTQMNTEEGEEVQALEEGGGVVDSYKKKSKYDLSFSLYEKKGTTKPIKDTDGIISDNYAIRMTPEDTEATGFIMKKCAVSFQYTYTAADGGRWNYKFMALLPKEGGMLEEYKAGVPGA